MAWYKTGTISVVNGQTSVTGVGTKFASNARVGDGLRGPDGEWYEVVNIASETTLGIYPAYQGATIGGSSVWIIAPMQGYVKESADRLRDITQQYRDISIEVQEAKDAADAAKVSETNAAASESDALTARDTAVAARDAAKASETAAKTSETNSKTSETNSKTSETNAKTSETNAAASATAADTSRTQAQTAETNAKAAQTAAETARNAAQTSEGAAATSATNSANSATASQTSATNSANSATASKASEDAAKVSETNAKTSETAAADSQVAAKAAEDKAKEWATNPEDAAVETDQYSAFHWSEKARKSAQDVADITGPRLTSIATAVLAVNDMLIADSTNTMAKIATGATGRTLLGTADAAAGRTALGLGTVSTESTVPVSKGGTGATNPTDARSNLGLGTAALADITTSTTDTTPGRLLRVQDFGVGSTSAVNMTDLTGTWAAGFYIVPANSPGLPDEIATTGGIFLALRSNFGILLQTSAGSTRLMFHGARSGTTGAITWRKVLSGGDYGIGAEVVPNINDFANNIESGVYYSFSAAHPQATPNGPPSPASGAMSVLAMGGLGTGYKAFLAIQNNSSGSGQKTYIGAKGAAGAPTWREVYTNVTAVGSVSQSGGVPSGAIIERGSNANGHYTKYADGTLIQWGAFVLNDATGLGNSNTAGGYRSAQMTITYPTPFASRSAATDLPIVLDAYCNNNAYGVRAFPADDNSVVTGQYVLTSSGSSVTVPASTLTIRWKATGRWY